MEAGEYRVSAPGVVTEQLKRALDLARTHGMYPLAVPSAKWMMEEMARTPHSFGESRGHLTHLQLSMRVAFVGPLMVEFAVHEPTRQVFVRRFAFTG